jgi:hypothetical protein
MRDSGGWKSAAGQRPIIRLVGPAAIGKGADIGGNNKSHCFRTDSDCHILWIPINEWETQTEDILGARVYSKNDLWEPEDRGGTHFQPIRPAVVVAAYPTKVDAESGPGLRRQAVLPDQFVDYGGEAAREAGVGVAAGAEAGGGYIAA